LTRFIAENWDKLAAFIFGGGVMYGAVRTHTGQVNAKMREHDEALHDMRDEIAVLGEDLQNHMLNCPVKLHEKLNKIAEDVSFMKGMLLRTDRELKNG